MCIYHVGLAVVYRVVLQKIDMTFVTRVSHVTFVRIYGSCSAMIFNPLSIPRYLEELFNFWATYTLNIFNNQIIVGQPRICTEWESRCSLRICRCGKPNNFASKISGLFVFYFWFSPGLIKVISKFITFPAALVGSSIGIPQLLSSNRAFKGLVKRFAFAFHYLV